MKKYLHPFVFLLLLANYLGPVKARTPAVNSSETVLVSVPVYFVGDRKPTGLFTGEKAVYQMIGNQNISWGKIEVPVQINKTFFHSVANKDDLGWKEVTKITAPNVTNQLKNKASTSINLGAGGGKVTPYNSTAFKECILPLVKNYLEGSNSKEFIYFVHGCCCTEETSFERAAQLAANSGLPIIMFDWATPGKWQAPTLPELHTYRQSERVLEISTSNFHNLTTALSNEIKLDCILVGHSMGNRIIFSDLLRRCSSKEIFFKQIHFIRPDMSLPAFILEEHNVCKFAGKFLVYVANNDKELAKSQFLSAGVPRLGIKSDVFLNLALKQNWSISEPRNRYFLDVSALNLNHRIPLELFGQIVKSGLVSNQVYKIEEAPSYNSNNFLNVSRTKTTKELRPVL